MGEEREANKQKHSFFFQRTLSPRVPALCCHWSKEKEGLGPSSPVVSVTCRLLDTYRPVYIEGGGERDIDRISNNINYLFT